ncbi:Ig-like domain repeat protein [Limnohabitans sp. DCL3]|uniref:Ig-like domain repeat protein n=1 Tax=Limnohabitans sp. DCL3 TaxID=3374103 RepID=UPI003A8C827A
MNEQKITPSETQLAQANTPAAAVTGAAARVKDSVNIHVPRSAVRELRVVDTDIVITTQDGKRLFVRDGAVRAMFDPEFALKFQDGVEISGQEVLQSTGSLQVNSATSSSLQTSEAISRNAVSVESTAEGTAGAASSVGPAAPAVAASAPVVAGGALASYLPWVAAATPLLGGLAAGATSPASSPVDLSGLNSVNAPVIYDLAVVNSQTAVQGLTVAGSADANALVKVTWGTSTKETTANASGLWSTQFSQAEIPTQGNANMVVASAKVGGKSSASATQKVLLDTRVDAPVISAISSGLVDGVVSANEKASGVTFSGTAESNATLKASWSGVEKIVQVSASGTWSVTYGSNEVPPDGTVPFTVSQTDAAGNVSPSTVKDLRVATRLDAPQIDTVAVDNRVNALEKTAGVTIGGSTIGNAAVHVTWGNTTRMTSAAEGGRWSVMFTADQVPSDGTRAVQVAVIDPLSGNTASVQRDILLDTSTTLPSITSVGSQTVVGSNTPVYVNALDKSANVQLSGRAEAGASVQLVWGDLTPAAVEADANGNWQLIVPADEVPGDGALPLRVVATDVSGNISQQASQAVVVDTVALPPVINMVAGDNKITAAEKQAGITVTGTAEALSQLEVVWGSSNQLVTASPTGAWSATFGSNAIPQGSSQVFAAVIADVAGNASERAASATIADNSTSQAPTIGTVSNGVINQQELSEANNALGSTQGQGVLVTGRAAPRASVTVAWAAADNSSSVPAKPVTASSTGVWSAYFPLVPQPANTQTRITVTAIDPGKDAESAAVATQDVIVDLFVALPTIDLIAGDDRINANEASAGVQFSGTAEPGASLIVTLNGINKVATASGGVWSTIFGADELPTQDISFPVRVQAQDAAGNSSPNAQRNVLISRTPPTLTFAQTQTDNADNYFSQNDALSSLTVSGTTSLNAANVQLNIVNAAGNTLQTLLAVIDGTGWQVLVPRASLTNATVFPDGTYTLQAQVTDTAGNVSTNSQALIVDRAVAVSIDDLVSQSGRNRIILADVTNQSMPITGRGDPGGVVTLQWLDAGQQVQFTQNNIGVDANGVWATAVTQADLVNAGLISGTAILRARIEDVARNTLSSSDKSVDMGLSGIVLGAFTMGGSDNVINMSERDHGFVFTGTSDPGLAINVAYNDATYQAVSTANGGPNGTAGWTLNLQGASNVPTASGNYAVVVTATDALGNSVNSTRFVRVDLEAPAVTLSTPVVAGQNWLNATDRANGITLSGTVTPPGSNIANPTVSVTWGSTTKTTNIVDSNGHWSLNFATADIPTSPTATAVQSNIQISATDAAGNTSALQSNLVTLDTLAQTPTVTSVGGNNVVNGSEKTLGVVVQGSAEPGATVSVLWTGTLISKSTTADSTTGAWSVTFTGGSEVPADTTTATVTVNSTDPRGNTASVTSSNVVIHTVIPGAPTLSSVAGGDAVVNISETQSPVTISGLALPDAAVSVVFQGNTYTSAAVGGQWSISIPQSLIPVASATPYSFSYSQTDTAGNLGNTSTSSFTVDDSRPALVSFSATSNDGVYRQGSSLTLTAHFDTVLQAGGTLNLTLNTGEQVALTSAANSSTASGVYSVGAGVNASDLTVSSYTIGSGSSALRNSIGNAYNSTALPVGNNLGDMKNIVIDNTGPTLSSSNPPSTALTTIAGTAGNSAGETVVLTVTFDGPVNGLIQGTADTTVFLLAGTGGVNATWGGANGSATRTLTYTILAGQNGQVSIDEAALQNVLTANITDVVGNAYTYTANSGNIPNIDVTPLPLIDTTPPVGAAGMTFISVTSVAGDPNPNDAITSASSGDVVFSYTGSDLAADEIFQYSVDGTHWTDVPAVDVSIAANTVKVAGLTFASSPTVVELRALDAAGNSTVVGQQAITFSDVPVGGSGMRFTRVSSDIDDLDLNDAVTNQASGDVVFTYTGSDLVAGEQFQYSLDGTTWANVAAGDVDATANTVTVSGLTLSNSPTVQVRSISAGGATTGVLASQAITYDAVAPTAQSGAIQIANGARLTTGASGLSFTQGMTIEFWYKTSNVTSGNSEPIFALKANNNTVNYSLSAGGGNFRVGLRGGSENATTSAGSLTGFNLSINTWAHVALVVSDSNSLVFYKNGVSTASFLNNASLNGAIPDAVNTSWELVLGKNYLNSQGDMTTTLQGTITGSDEIRDLKVWDGQRTVSQILSQTVSAADVSDLKLYLPGFDAAGSASVTDSTDLANPLTNAGTAGSVNLGLAANTNLDLRTASDTGLNTTDNITAVTTPTIDVMALGGTRMEATDRLVLQKSDGTELASYTVTAADLLNGVWVGGKLSLTVSASAPLAVGSVHTLQLVLKDTAGNATNVGSSLSVDVRTVVPPVALDLSGDGQITYTEATIDVNLDGQTEHSGWVGGQDGLLFWDKFGDGSLRETGQYQFAQAAGQSDLQGLAEVFDSNQDGLFSAADASFGDFKAWVDADQNGVSSASELRSLVELGIQSLQLRSDGVPLQPDALVQVQGSATAQLSNGHTMLVHDSLFWTQPSQDPSKSNHVIAA